MNLRLASLALLLAGLSPRALAQDNTLLFENFENGVPANWTVGAPWHLVQNGECGAVSQMMSFGSGAPACNYVGSSQMNQTLLLPDIYAPLAQHPLQIAFDYVLDIDPTGDAVGIVVANSAHILVFNTETQRFENDGALHSVVLSIPGFVQPWLGLTVGIFVSTDGVGDLGRGLAVDNVRVSSTLAGMVFCESYEAGVCPCGNLSGNYSGCRNSTGIGATLRGSGNPSVTADTFQLGVSQVQNGAPTLYFEGSSAANTLFGDGHLCASGSLVRLKLRISPTNNSAFPEPSEPRISVLSPVTAGSTRHYQALYRDVGGPCGSGFNLTNGWRVTWGL